MAVNGDVSLSAEKRCATYLVDVYGTAQMAGHVGSKALFVLLAFQADIRLFVDASDVCSVRRSSRWLRNSMPVSSTRSPRAIAAVFPTDDELHNLAHRLQTRLIAGSQSRRRKNQVRLTTSQIRLLLRDLLLVASGLRASCLVDCCALTSELAELLLQSLCVEIESLDIHHFAVDQLRAVVLDGNVFFLNVETFMREKMLTLANTSRQQLYVDVSASLSLPQIIRNAARLEAFNDWTINVCNDLLATTSTLVLEWRRPKAFNATALAGILLCYPCVYDIFKDANDDDLDGWIEQENCLAMTPLLVFQTSLQCVKVF
ncbi:hypothetical protein PHYBOEH_005659 [Phytophthora boehmeriae]|uniref:Uncharacterized protein n=1 Tax=Phytophthora boehmeriae TaxID=109152 RepID=A0A8T1WNQ9_9STRA|nr:hypothetical protein PHYBOEH_005659 [Phytophthora boehmeriae]